MIMKTKKVPFILVFVLLFLLFNAPPVAGLLLLSYGVYRYLNRDHDPEAQASGYNLSVKLPKLSRATQPTRSVVQTAVSTTPEVEERLLSSQELAQLSEHHQKLHQLTWALRDQTQLMASTSLHREVQQLLKTTKKITGFVDKNPSSVTQLNQFVDYYLPTTIELLDTYTELRKQDNGGDHIQGTAGKIEDLLDTLQAAYSKQLDCLYEDKSNHVTAEIATLSSLLETDGLIATGV